MKKRKTESRTAEAFLYSGRANPQWRLDQEQFSEWKKQWQEAVHSDQQAGRLSVLGYTGCLLQNDEHSYWIIFNGTVSFYEKDIVINKKDAHQQMEQWLLSTAPDEVRKIATNL